MTNKNLERLTQFIDSHKLREFVFDYYIDLIDFDSEIINLVFQMEMAQERLDEKIKTLYIKKYYGNEKNERTNCGIEYSNKRIY